jgi:hypothetical protein
VTAPLDPPRRSAGARAAIVVSVLIAAVAVVVALLVWIQPLPDLTAEDARQFSAGAFEAAGFTEGRVRPDVETATSGEGGAEFDVWVTITDLDGQPVEMWIDLEGNQAVLIDDNTEDGPLLTDEQFGIVDDYDVHPRAGERRRRNWLVTVAAGLAVVVAIVVVMVTGRRTRTARPTPTESPAPPSTPPSPPPGPDPAAP